MEKSGKFLDRADGGYFHWCPACETKHYIAVDKPLNNGALWSFDGNAQAPTFNPSVRVSIPAAHGLPTRCCHYFIRAGTIEYCADCTHALAGKTVDLPEVPD